MSDNSQAMNHALFQRPFSYLSTPPRVSFAEEFKELLLYCTERPSRQCFENMTELQQLIIPSVKTSSVLMDYCSAPSEPICHTSMDCYQNSASNETLDSPMDLSGSCEDSSHPWWHGYTMSSCPGSQFRSSGTVTEGPTDGRKGLATDPRLPLSPNRRRSLASPEPEGRRTPSNASRREQSAESAGSIRDGIRLYGLFRHRKRRRSPARLKDRSPITACSDPNAASPQRSRRMLEKKKLRNRKAWPNRRVHKSSSPLAEREVEPMN